MPGTVGARRARRLAESRRSMAAAPRASGWRKACPAPRSRARGTRRRRRRERRRGPEILRDRVRTPRPTHARGSGPGRQVGADGSGSRAGRVRRSASACRRSRSGAEGAHRGETLRARGRRSIHVTAAGSRRHYSRSMPRWRTTPRRSSTAPADCPPRGRRRSSARSRRRPGGLAAACRLRSGAALCRSTAVGTQPKIPMYSRPPTLTMRIVEKSGKKAARP